MVVTTFIFSIDLKRQDESLPKTRKKSYKYECQVYSTLHMNFLSISG